MALASLMLPNKNEKAETFSKKPQLLIKQRRFRVKINDCFPPFPFMDKPNHMAYDMYHLGLAETVSASPLTTL